ncbi:protein SSUH2 homolog isoform X1 [Folsomia candida]|uniref:protein SSUH2 homolog isoform X1 n=1 Tax=Folsomia candida TaxID=158441 RepID=UPI001604E5EE|nr:protein SSUH2 homolog isoform X1 [Folsomia candida]
MKPRGHRSERARARLEFRHSKPTRGSVANPFGHSRGSLTPDGVYEPYSDPFASFSLFQRRCRARSAGEDGDILPAAPPLEILDAVAGYEILSFDSVSIPPPEPYGDLGSLDPEQQQILGTWSPNPSPDYNLRTDIPQVTEPTARSALMGYVKNHCCWGGGAAKHMTITGIRHNSAYHYVLQTLTEKREARWSWSPHVAGDVDGPENGLAPAPWDIPAFPTKFFRTEIKAIEIPHTASIKPCHRCRGTGTLACPNCHGKGWTRCLSCQGEGWGLGSESRERCIVCGTSSHGHGRIDCNRCDTKGRVACSVCDSYGQLKCFIQLSVSWKVNIGEHITGADEIETDLLRGAEGQIGIEDFGVHLTPLPADVIADETLAMASIQLINEHIQNSSDSLLLAQRHQVRVIPVTCIDYKWKSHTGSYYVYGLDNKVYAPDYPQTCCCFSRCIIV